MTNARCGVNLSAGPWRGKNNGEFWKVMGSGWIISGKVALQVVVLPVSEARPVSSRSIRLGRLILLDFKKTSWLARGTNWRDRGWEGECNPIKGSRTLKLAEYTVNRGVRQRVNKRSCARAKVPFYFPCSVLAEEAYQLIILPDSSSLDCQQHPQPRPLT
jgi:hypothetical protein